MKRRIAASLALVLVASLPLGARQPPSLAAERADEAHELAWLEGLQRFCARRPIEDPASFCQLAFGP